MAEHEIAKEDYEYVIEPVGDTILFEDADFDFLKIYFREGPFGAHHIIKGIRHHKPSPILNNATMLNSMRKSTMHRLRHTQHCHAICCDILAMNFYGLRVHWTIKHMAYRKRHRCGHCTGMKVYVDHADSLVIDRREYFDWHYDVFKVWKGNSAYCVDIRGHNPDVPGYSPLKDDTNVMDSWPL